MHDAVLDALTESFGDNAGFALELYAQYRLNPGTVGDDWRRTFEQFEKTVRARGGAVSGRAVRSAGRRRPPPPPFPPVGGACAAHPGPCAPAGEKLVPLVGGSATIARNMDASLSVPTATSQRVIPVKAMEENRRILNHHREAVRQSKISFTHLVAWAIVRALEKHPGMNDAYVESEGKPQRVRKPHVNLGVAVDVTKKDGSRSLLVPNIKLAEELDFAEFVATFDNLVGKARRGTIEPEAFLGTSISLTNPGTLGTTSSSPRLMPGQGCIVATGAMGYPPEYQAMPDEVVASLGISRVMTVTSTYDHRIVQGAESGAFLATLQELLLGARRLLRADLRRPPRPAPARRLGAGQEPALPRRRLAPRGGREAGADPPAHQLLPGPRAPPRRPRPARLRHAAVPRRARPGDLRLHDLGPRPEVHHERPRGAATRRRSGRSSRSSAQTYCGKIGAEFMNIQDPAAEGVAHGAHGGVPEPRDASRRTTASGSSPSSSRRRASRSSSTPSTSATSASPSRGARRRFRS